MIVRMKVLVFGLLFVFGACVAVPLTLEAASPCCGVTAIDAKAGSVTAKNFATGEIFQFTVDKAAISKVKVGDAVDANFQAGKVAITKYSAEPCCAIVQAPKAKVMQQAAPDSPRLPGTLPR